MSKYLQISVLPVEDQDAAVAYLDAKYPDKGPVTTLGKIVDRSGLLWCGHPTSSTIKDKSGVELCPTCCGIS
jgi:hypothetical protein